MGFARVREGWLLKESTQQSASAPKSGRNKVEQLWDGHATERIVAAVTEFFRRRQPAAQYASIDAAKSR
jgi:hypothetical protein